jgi:SpoVK/Ycf46/Vps4 family AAA+-type ATPase
MSSINSSNIRSPIVIAVSNRPFNINKEVLYYLGRCIIINIPDTAAREEILKIYLKGETIVDKVLSELIEATPDFTGSELKDLT